MTREYRIGQEVLAHLGCEVLSRLHRTAARYWCSVCDQPGNAEFQATSVRLYRHSTDDPQSGASTTVFAHARCAPSQLLSAAQRPAPPPTTPHVLGGMLGWDERPYAALLLQERPAGVCLEPAAGEPAEAVLRHYRDHGFVAAATAEPVPPLLDGWAVALADGGRRLTGISGPTDRAGPGWWWQPPGPQSLMPPRAWRTAARGRASVLLLVGESTSRVDSEADRFYQVVADALAAGRLVAGRVALRGPRGHLAGASHG